MGSTSDLVHLLTIASKYTLYNIWTKAASDAYLTLYRRLSVNSG